jgi:hypothetical protein
MMASYTPFFYVLIFVLMMLAVAWLGTVVYLFLRRRWKWALGVATVGLAGPAWLIVLILHPFGPVRKLRILDRAQLADGTQLVLTQSRNLAWAEPYTIDFWLKPPDRPWGCLLIDHESVWWRRGRIQVEGERITLLRGGKVFCSFVRQGRAFVTSEDDEPMSPFWMGRDWAPREGGEYQDAMTDAAIRGDSEAPADAKLNETRPELTTGTQAMEESHGREQR